MIQVSAFSGKQVAVMGLGRSGLSAVQALTAGGAEVWAWDDTEDMREQADQAGVKLTDLYHCDWSRPEALVLSPGIPDQFPTPHPIADLAHKAGCEIICDVDLLGRAIKSASFVGITGTNGKSTTTALIGHILNAAEHDVEIGGNYGIPALDMRELGEDGTYVLELSSYQLERIPTIQLDVAILLNITPDHLDRHGGMDGYVAAKRRIFDHTKESSHAIIGMEDSHCRGLCLELMVDRGGKGIIPISASGRVAGGVYVEEGYLIDDMDYGQAKTHVEGQVRVLDLSEIGTLPGHHNWQNATAAYAAARLAGIDRDVIADALRTYPGLPHRQELIGRIGDVFFINDSKATNSEAAAKALACYNRIYWIAGGQFKEDNIDAIEPYLPHIAHAYLIGDAQNKFAEMLGDRVPVSLCGELAKAVEAATEEAKQQTSAIVMLSPACASFDQFSDFQARGEAFRSIVGEMEAAI